MVVKYKISTSDKRIKIPLPTWGLHFYSLVMMISWSIDVKNECLKIKFHSNENIKWHCMQPELILILILFDFIQIPKLN
jgi:hypothetical protein